MARRARTKAAVPAEAPTSVEAPQPPAAGDDDAAFRAALRAFAASIPVRAAWLHQRGVISRAKYSELMKAQRDLDAALLRMVTEEEDRA